MTIQQSSPVVSVMIPTFNQAHCVIDAIESARAQTYRNLEIVVADDCSADATRDVVAAHLESCGDPRVRYVRRPQNLGILRNYHQTLVDDVGGEWVINLDGDDRFIDDTFIEKCMDQIARADKVVLAFGGYAELLPDGRLIPIRSGLAEHCLEDTAFFRAYAEGGVKWNHNSILYRRAAALDVSCYWDGTSERNDWESFLRMVVGSRVAVVNSVAAAWVQHGLNETRRIDPDKYKRNFLLVDGVAKFAGERGMPPQFVADWRRMMFRWAAKDAATAFLLQRDYRGCGAFLCWIARRDVRIILATLLDWQLWAKAGLAVSPGLYAWCKRAYHARSQA